MWENCFFAINTHTHNTERDAEGVEIMQNETRVIVGREEGESETEDERDLIGRQYKIQV